MSVSAAPDSDRAAIDAAARAAFLAALQRHLADAIFPGLEAAYRTRVKPAFMREHGREPIDRHEVRQAMVMDAYYRLWRALEHSCAQLQQTRPMIEPDVPPQGLPPDEALAGFLQHEAARGAAGRS